MTHFIIPRWQPRPQPAVVLTDGEAKSRLSRARIILKDGPVPVEGRIIGWQRTGIGALGAIAVNAVTGARFLVGVNLTTDPSDRRPWRILKRLALPRWGRFGAAPSPITLTREI